MPLLGQNDLTRILHQSGWRVEVRLAVRVGSQVYGTATPESDTDFVVVGLQGKDSQLLFGPDYNVTLWSAEKFHDLLYRCQNLFSAEVWFTPPEHRLVDRLEPPRFHVMGGILHHTAKEKSDSDWNKGLKLMGHETDKARKKIWHSLRIPLFAQQLVRDGSITDYGAANDLFLEIMTEPSEDPTDYVKYDEIRQDTLASLVR